VDCDAFPPLDLKVETSNLNIAATLTSLSEVAPRFDPKAISKDVANLALSGCAFCAL
jgi:hypothetical protein